jgi:hypothetical protein
VRPQRANAGPGVAAAAEWNHSSSKRETIFPNADERIAPEAADPKNLWNFEELGERTAPTPLAPVLQIICKAE